MQSNAFGVRAARQRLSVNACRRCWWVLHIDTSLNLRCCRPCWWCIASCQRARPTCQTFVGHACPGGAADDGGLRAAMQPEVWRIQLQPEEGLPANSARAQLTAAKSQPLKYSDYVRVSRPFSPQHRHRSATTCGCAPPLQCHGGPATEKSRSQLICGSALPAAAQGTVTHID